MERSPLQGKSGSETVFQSKSDAKLSNSTVALLEFPIGRYNYWA